MENWVNKITYGNLSFEQMQILSKNCIADDVIPILEAKYGDKLNHPCNDSEIVKQELNEMVDQISLMEEEGNSEYFIRYKHYDRSLSQSIIAAFQNKGLNVEKIVLSILADISPTIMKLKQKYQRPRPYQLGNYYKLKIFPYNTTSGHSPSYPSGHTLQAYVVLNIIGNKNPETYEFCQKLIEDISNSRVYLGHHFPSDNDASLIIGQEILQLKSIVKKYKI